MIWPDMANPLNNGSGALVSARPCLYAISLQSAACDPTAPSTEEHAIPVAIGAGMSSYI